MAAVLCYPYGVTITCVCDNSGSVYNCYPTNYKNKHSNHLANSPLQVRIPPLNLLEVVVCGKC